jgi:trimeric autotransporter adhesin
MGYCCGISHLVCSKKIVMKTPFVFVLLSVLLSLNIAAQNNIGIGTVSPDASARLDITATDKGILIPRVSITNVSSAAPVTSPAAGLLIWNTNAAITGGSGIGFYYWDGIQWQNILSNTKGWNLTGNGGTNPALQFFGTTDNQPLNFRVNNLPAGNVEIKFTNTSAGSINQPAASLFITVIQ